MASRGRDEHNHPVTDGEGHPDETGRKPGEGSGVSVYDRIRPGPDHRRLARLPRLVTRTVQMVRSTGGAVFWVSAAVQFVAGVVVTGQILVARQLLDRVIDADRSGLGLSAVAPTLVLFVALTAVVGLSAAATRELSALLSELVARDATGRILDVATSVDLESFDTPAFHDRLERARFNANNRPVMAVNGLVGMLNGAVAAIGVSVGLAVLHPLLVPVTLIGLVPLWVAERRNGRSWYEFTRSMVPVDRERIYLANTLASRPLAGEIRAFGSGPFLRERFDHLYRWRLDALSALVRRRLWTALAGSLAASVATALTVLLLFWLLLSDRLDLASAGAAVLAITYLGQRLRTFAASAGTLYESSLFVEDYFDFVEMSPGRDPISVEDSGDRLPDLTAESASRVSARIGFESIVVNDVSFTYPGMDRPAVDGVSLEIGAGEIVALVGANGSGKTTLAKLLGLLYRPTSGQILWDDEVVAGGTGSADPAMAARRSIAVILQDFGQYWLSAHDNIAIGDLDRRGDVDGVHRAAEASGADEFLTELPQRYQTVLSRLVEGGRDLSIGQWQRVALARALFRDAPLVIMDEPSAALDPAAEARLFDQISQLASGRSVLLISHRFSSVRSADRIHVMDHGRLVESGSHDDLMAMGGRYATMFNLQAAAYLDPQI